MVAHTMKKILGYSSTVLFFTLSMLAGSFTAQAGHWDPSWRGDANSTYTTLSYGYDPGGNLTFSHGPSGYALDGQPSAVLTDPDQLDVIIPNFIDPLPIKHMRIQLSFDGTDMPASEMADHITIFAEDDGQSVPWELVGLGGSDGRFDGHNFYFDFDIWPSPDWEQITFQGLRAGRNLLWIEIDTISTVPLPAAVWLFGSGLLGLIGFSKRKKAA